MRTAVHLGVVDISCTFFCFGPARSDETAASSSAVLIGSSAISNSGSVATASGGDSNCNLDGPLANSIVFFKPATDQREST